MFSYIWHTFFFDPVYNTLVFFIDVIPNGDVGLAIIATVILVKLVLFPVSIKAVQTQKVMKEIQPKIKDIKERYKDDREKQAREMMLVYKEHQLNPFSSIFIILLQIPIIIALYFSVLSIFSVDPETAALIKSINSEVLYSFIPEPAVISEFFLGQFNIAERSILLALLAGITQYIHINFMMPQQPPIKPGEKVDFQTELMNNMQKQMKFVMPIMITGIAYFISAAIALYFVVSNLFALLQEFYVRRHR
jgi:YidC/Oxa1 family membrane protein insertase